MGITSPQWTIKTAICHFRSLFNHQLKRRFVCVLNSLPKNRQ